MKDGINIFYPDGRNEFGKALITPTEIVIYKKSMAILLAFGLLGSSLDKGKERLKINISDIVSGKQEKFRLKKNAYYITLKDGTTYVLCFDRPSTTIPYLESLISECTINNENDTIVCPQCKKELPGDSEFCQYCGSKIISTNTHPNFDSTLFTDAPDEPANQPNKKKYSKIAAIAVILTVILITLIATIAGVNSSHGNDKVEWISKQDFLYYEEENTYVLLFELADENETPMKSSGTVEMRLVNNDGVTVYNKSKKFTESNFENWIQGGTDKYMLATIYITPDEITKGSTEYGVIYFTVYGDNYSFDEWSLYVSKLPTQSNSSNSNSNFEDTPPTCLEYSCNNVVTLIGHYCSEHKCANATCSFKKDYNSNYCSVCRCSSAGCKNAEISNGSYCIEHTCTATDCTSEKSYGKNYCFHHTCTRCDNIRVAGGFYCADHTCITAGCTSIKSGAPPSNYCSLHQCMAGTCSNGRINGGSYCSYHTCIVQGCTRQKLGDYNYCYYHTS